MESFRFQLTVPQPDVNEDVEMSPSEVGLQRRSDLSLLQAELPGRPSSQLVLHSSRRRRRASQELTPSLDENSSKSPGGGWRPVRLQGYSEDPMKDEIIRGQTETIKLLQLQLQNLQNSHDNSDAVDRRAEEAELALRQEQAKAAEQEELIECLRKELRIRQVDDEPKSARKLLHLDANNLERPADSRSLSAEINAQTEGPATPGAVSEDSPMILEQGSREGTAVTHSSVQDVLNFGHDSLSKSPKVAAVPLPLTFKKAWGRRRPARSALKNSPQPMERPDPPTWTNSSASTSATSAVSGNQANPVASLEAKVDLIMNTLGIIAGKDSLHSQQHGRRLRASEFRTPTPRVPKAEGRNERLAWVHNELQSLLGIKQDRDILDERDVLYCQDTPLKRQMVHFEKDARGPGPTTLEPMHVNWDVIYGRWNERLFSLFLTHCKEGGYCGGIPTEEDEDEISDFFFKRLERIHAIIKQYRPKINETMAQADERYGQRHLMKLSVARRNRRRAELFNARCDINMDHLPEDFASVENADEETKRWIDRYKINEAFGIEGTSSDGTDEYDSDAFFVHVMKWRNRNLAKKARSTDAARRTTNEYGNTRPGNRPRTRKRRSGDESKESLRKVPAGLPINCYDENWYNALSAKKRRDLCTKPALEILAAWDSD